MRHFYNLTKQSAAFMHKKLRENVARCCGGYLGTQAQISGVHGKEKYAPAPMDQLLRKAAGQWQKLLVHT